MRPIALRSFVAALSALFLVPGFACASEQPLPTKPSIELQLSARDFGNHFVFDASGELLFELTPPYRDAPNTSDIYNSGRSIHQPINNLYSWDPRRPTVPPKLLAGDRHRGVWIGGAAPDGKHVALYSANAGIVRPGIFDAASKRIRWLDFTPEFDWWQEEPAWVSDKIVVFPALPKGEVPGALFLLQLRKRLQDAWTANAAGTQSQPTVISSGRLGSDRAPEPKGALMRVDAETGKETVLADGAYYNLLPSPHHQILAALRDHGAAPKSSQKVDLDANDYEIVVFDLSAGGQFHPCADCTVSMPTLQWSADGTTLTFFASPRGASRTAGEFYRYRVGSDRAEKVLLPGLTVGCTFLERGPGRIYPVSGGEFVFAAANAATSPYSERACDEKLQHNWYFVGSNGSLKSFGSDTAALQSNVVGLRDDKIVALIDEGLFSSSGKLFALSIDGTTKRVAADSADPIHILHRWESPLFTETDRTFDQFPTENVALLETDKQALMIDLKSDAVKTLPKDQPKDMVVAASANLERAAFLRTSKANAFSLYSKSTDGTTNSVEHINDAFDNIRPPQYRSLTYDFNGQKLTSLIMLPADWTPGKPLPTIVDVYPASTGACREGVFGGAGAFTFFDNSLLAAQGYAALCPADPTPLARTKTLVAANLTALTLAAVDASVAAGYTDPNRLGLFGFSQGYHRALTIATQTCRFSAVVAGNGISDFSSQYGDIPNNLLLRTDPSAGPASGAPRFETDNGTGAAVDYVGGAPWEIPDVYRENSPYYHAAGATAPILLVHSDFDQFALSQSAQMFSALYRLNKDAQYVIYWGEGHGNLSPNNIQDYWNRVFGWYDKYLGGARADGHGTNCHEATRPLLQ